jgi:hypothetical protein
VKIQVTSANAPGRHAHFSSSMRIGLITTGMKAEVYDSFDAATSTRAQCVLFAKNRMAANM